MAWQVSCIILSLFSLALKSLLESCSHRSILYFPVTPLGIFGLIFWPDVVIRCSTVKFYIYAIDCFIFIDVCLDGCWMKCIVYLLILWINIHPTPLFVQDLTKIGASSHHVFEGGIILVTLCFISAVIWSMIPSSTRPAVLCSVYTPFLFLCLCNPGAQEHQ